MVRDWPCTTPRMLLRWPWAHTCVVERGWPVRRVSAHPCRVSSTGHPGQEVRHRFPPRLRVLELRRVPGVRDDDELRTGNGLVHLAGRFEERCVLFADDHEHRQVRRQAAELVQGVREG